MDVFKVLNGVESHLLTFGNPFESRGSEIIVVITGSPGITEFYREFAQQLYSNTKLPVCVVGHAGHDVIQNLDEQRYINTDLFNLDNQVKHKLQLLNKHIDASCKLHIIGHSMGAWILLELLDKNDHLIERTCSLNLLFPALQKISETTNGKYVKKFLKRLFRLVMLLFYICYWLPSFLLSFFIKIYLIIVSWPLHYVDRVKLYLNPVVQKRSLELAFECLKRINDLNREAIKKVQHLTNVVYCLEDGWVPMHHIKDLTFAAHLSLTEVNVSHAFVLKNAELVADVVSKLIKMRSSFHSESLNQSHGVVEQSLTNSPLQQADECQDNGEVKATYI